jgi:hypothetical protein
MTSHFYLQQQLTSGWNKRDPPDVTVRVSYLVLAGSRCYADIFALHLLAHESCIRPISMDPGPDLGVSDRMASEIYHTAPPFTTALCLLEESLEHSKNKVPVDRSLPRALLYRL